MSEPLSQDNFDYTQFDKDTSLFLQGEAGKIKGLLTQTIESIVEIGSRLIEVKTSLQHGQYRQWLHSEFEMSIRTADNFTRVAKCFNDANFSELDIAKSALYLLAAPSVPDEAREEALDVAKNERVSQRKATEIIEAHKNSSTEELSPIPPTQKVKTGKRHRRKETKEKSKDPTSRSTSRKDLQVAKGEVWGLGRYHRLFCGDATSQKFQRLIPEDISLVIYFPDDVSGWPTSIPGNVKTVWSFYTALDDFHLDHLRENLESCISGTTDPGETIAMLGLPHPSLFILIEQLEVSCICAEADPNICTDAVTAWTLTTKRKAKRVIH